MASITIQTGGKPPILELVTTKRSLPLRILIVDDNMISQRILEKYLGKHNPQHILSSVGSGADAVTALKRSEYDLVFMDICMPVMVSEIPARACSS